ncbi:hypothetical protein ABZU32_15435 [Sphaerisporangium sp. NPDC005288]|uniref:Uncharacterized protein n=1 Tax=Sphaerisporangium rhizosphaerae TaxID=2269375 RepID=A0ABW2PAG0_9ACTN
MAYLTKIVRRHLATLAIVATALASAAIMWVDPGIPWQPDGGFGWGDPHAMGETVDYGPPDGTGFGWGFALRPADGPAAGGAGAAPPATSVGL